MAASFSRSVNAVPSAARITSPGRRSAAAAGEPGIGAVMVNSPSRLLDPDADPLVLPGQFFAQRLAQQRLEEDGVVVGEHLGHALRRAVVELPLILVQRRHRGGRDRGHPVHGAPFQFRPERRLRLGRCREEEVLVLDQVPNLGLPGKSRIRRGAAVTAQTRR